MYVIVQLLKVSGFESIADGERFRTWSLVLQSQASQLAF